MGEASTLYGFNLCHGVRQQPRDVTSKILGAKFIVYWAIGRESRQSIGYVPQARDSVPYRWQAQSCSCTACDQHQRYTDDHPEDTATHSARSPGPRLPMANSSSLREPLRTSANVGPAPRKAIIASGARK